MKKLQIFALAALFLGLSAVVAYLVSRPAISSRLRPALVRYVAHRLGCGIQVGALELALWTPTVEVRDLKVACEADPEAPPLLEVPLLKVTLSPVQALFGELRIRSLEMNDPKAYLDLDETGWHNGPRHKGKGGAAALPPLRVDSFRFEGGRVLWKGGRDRSSVEVRGLSGRLAFDLASQTFQIDRLQGEVWDSAAAYRGKIRGFSKPEIQGKFLVLAALPDVRRLVPGLPPVSGRVEAEGDLHGPVDALEGEGEVTLSDVRIRQYALEDVKAHAAVDASEIRVSGLEARWGGGTVEGSARAHRGGTWDLSATLQVHSIELARLVSNLGLEGSRAVGTVDATADLAGPLRPGGDWGSFHLGGRARAQIRDFQVLQTDWRIERGNSTLMRVRSGDVDTSLEIDAEGIALPLAEIRLPSSRIRLTDAMFHFDDRIGMEIRADSDDFDLRDAFPIAGVELAGSAQFSARVHGPYADPMIEGDTQVASTEFLGYRMGNLVGEVRYAREVLQFPLLRGIRGGSPYAFEGRVSLGGRAVLQGQAEFSDFRLEDAADMIRAKLDVPFPVAGTADGDLQLWGDVTALEGRGSALLFGAGAFGETATTGRVVLQIENGDLNFQEVTLRVGSRGGVTAHGALTALGEVSLAFATHGLRIGDSKTIRAARLPVDGDLSVEGRLSGQVSRWAFTLDALADHAEWGGSPRPAAALHLEARPEEMVGWARMEDASVEVSFRSGLGGRRVASLRASARGADLEPLLFYEVGKAGVTGQATGDLEWTRPADPARPASGRLRLTDLRLAEKGQGLEADGQIVVAWEGRRWTLTPFQILGPETALRVERPADASSGAGVVLTGDLPLWAMGFLTDQVSEGSGVARIRLRLDEGSRGIQGRGSVDCEQGSIGLTAFGERLQEIAGSIAFEPSGISINSFRARFFGGDLTLGGRVETEGLRPRLLNVTGAIDGARVFFTSTTAPWLRNYLTGSVSAQGSGTWVLHGTWSRPRMDGEFKISQATVRGLANLQPALIGGGRAYVPEAAPEGGLGLGLLLHVPGTVEVRTDLAALSLGGDLRIEGSTSRWGATGSLAIAGGQVYYRGTQMTLRTGLLSFTDPRRLAPILDVVAVTERETYDVIDRTRRERYRLTLTASGPVDALQITLASDPPLDSEADVRCLLLTNRRCVDISTGTVAAAELAPVVMNRILDPIFREELGLQLDTFDFSPQSSYTIATLPSATPANTSFLTVGKRVGDRFVARYSVNLGGAGQKAEMEYQVGPHTSLLSSMDNTEIQGALGGAAALSNFNLGTDVRFRFQFR